MTDKTKCIAVNLNVKQIEKIKQIKKETGKSQNAIITECIEKGVENFLFGNKQLFLVKVRIDTSKMMELGEKLQSGELDTSMIKFTYCIKDDPTVGISLWEAETQEEFNRLFAPHKKYYKDIIEIKPTILPEEAMNLIMQSMS